MKESSKEGMWNEYQAAEYLGMSVSTLRYWRYKMKGPHYVKYPCSKAVRYSKDDLDIFLGSHRVEPSYS